MTAPTAASARFTAIVLAGSRGPGDPVAAAAGVSHKAVAPVAGTAMLARVLQALAAVPRVGRVVVVIDRPELARTLPAVAAGLGAGALALDHGAASPSQSVLAALERDDVVWPVLLTTADHALLTPAMVAHVLDHLPEDADAIAAVVRAETVRAAHPDTRRTYTRLGRDHWSGCNLFVLATPAARGVVDLWRTMERDRKRPWRMVRRLGLATLARFLVGRLSTDAALRRLGQMSGARLALVELPFAEAAIDVDSPADLALAERILRAREATPSG